MDVIVGMYLAVVRIIVFGLNSRTADRRQRPPDACFQRFCPAKNADMKFCTQSTIASSVLTCHILQGL